MKHARPALLTLSLLALAASGSAQSAAPVPPAPPPPPAAPAAPARPPAAEIAARMPKARALVAITNPNDAMVEANMRGWEAGVAQVFVVDPGARSIEQRYPGAAKAAIDAARPLARDYCQQFVTEVNDYKASLLAERLTPAELDSATAFFSSPAGRRLVQHMMTNADPAALARDATTRASQTGQVSITADRIREMERVAARQTMSELPADDHVALLRFGQTVAATKYKLVAAEVDAFALDKANHPNAEWMARQSELVNRAIVAFVDAHKTS